MKMNIKDWKMNQINEEAHRYNWTLVRKDNNDGTYEVNVVEQLRETEKAVFVKLEVATYNDDYREFKSWIPKSCIA